MARMKKESRERYRKKSKEARAGYSLNWLVHTHMKLKMGRGRASQFLMDRIIVWNVRGANSPRKQRDIKSFLNCYPSGLICLLETKRKARRGPFIWVFFKGIFLPLTLLLRIVAGFLLGGILILFHSTSFMSLVRWFTVLLAQYMLLLGLTAL